MNIRRFNNTRLRKGKKAQKTNKNGGKIYTDFCRPNIRQIYYVAALIYVPYNSLKFKTPRGIILKTFLFKTRLVKTETYVKGLRQIK